MAFRFLPKTALLLVTTSLFSGLASPWPAVAQEMPGRALSSTDALTANPYQKRRALPPAPEDVQPELPGSDAGTDHKPLKVVIPNIQSAHQVHAPADVMASASDGEGRPQPKIIHVQDELARRAAAIGRGPAIVLGGPQIIRPEPSPVAKAPPLPTMPTLDPTPVIAAAPPPPHVLPPVKKLAGKAPAQKPAAADIPRPAARPIPVVTHEVDAAPLSPAQIARAAPFNRAAASLSVASFMTDDGPAKAAIPATVKTASLVKVKTVQPAPAVHPAALSVAAFMTDDGPAATAIVPAEAKEKAASLPVVHSPGAIIRKETLHMAKMQPEMEAAPDQYMAELAPSAGGGDASAANGPLIPIPAIPAPPPAIEDAKPLLPPPAPSTPVIPASAPSEKTPIDAAAVDSMLESMRPPASVPKEELPAIAKDKPADKTAKADSPPVKKTTAEKAKSEKTTAEKPAIDASEGSEPVRELSEASKKIASKIPSHLVKKKDTSKPVTIDRASEIKSSGDESVETVKHEAMGIKIEVKTPKYNADYELEKAYEALTAGNTPEAVEIYKGVLANDPNNKGALFGLAACYHRTGQIELARPLYAKLLAIDPGNRDGLNNFLVLMADEAPEDALTQLEQLEKRNPDFSPIPAQMGVIYQKLGDPQKAVGKMTRAITLSPENLTYRYNLAVILDQQKNYEEAGKLYRQIIEAAQRGEKIPGNLDKIQQRLTFISSNRP